VRWRAYWLSEAVGDLLDIASADRRQATRIYRAVESLARTEQGDIRKLTDRSDEWRLRVGDWRVLFVFDGLAQSMTVQTIKRRNEGTYRD